MSPFWVRAHGDDVVLTLHVQPGARRSEVAGEHGDALKIRLAAPPVGGKANTALIEFIAHRLQVPRARIELLSGAASRHKRILIRGMPAAHVIVMLGIGA